MGVINLKYSAILCGGFTFDRKDTNVQREVRKIFYSARMISLAPMLHTRAFFSMAFHHQENRIYAVGGMRCVGEEGYMG